MEAFNAATEEQREKLWQLEDQLAGIYASTLRRAGKLAASRFKTVSQPQPVLAAGVPSPGWVPPDPEELVTREELRELSRKRLEHLWKRAVTLALLSYSDRFDVAFSVLNPFAAELLLTIGARDSMVWDAYRDEISRTIGESYEEGKSVPDAARAIRENVAGLKNSTAKMVARTDLNALSNGASIAAASALGDQAPQYKMWLSAGDDKVRPDHVEANRQVVPTSQPFKVGAEEMMFPGDPTASDAEVCNCRCTLIYTDEHGMVAAAWDESKHPREARGSRGGGRFRTSVVTEYPDDAMDEVMDWSNESAVDHAGNVLMGDEPAVLVRDKEAKGARLVAVAGLHEEPDALYVSSIGSDVPGAGTEAMKKAAAEAWLKDKPLRVVSEPEALGFYKKLGMREVGRNNRNRVLEWTPEEAHAFSLTAAAVDFTAGSMVALYPHPDQALMLEQPDGQPAEDLHITLCYLPNGWDGDKGAAMTSLVEIATVWGKLEGTVTGVSCFPEGEDGVPWIAVPNVRSLMDLRDVVASVLEDAGVTISGDYEFTPHITLGYGVEPSRDVVGVPLTFTAISAVDGPERVNIPLEPELTAAGWDESKHPRHERGKSEGGKFRSKEQIEADMKLEQETHAPGIELGLGEANGRKLALDEWMTSIDGPQADAALADMKGWLERTDLAMRVPETVLDDILTEGEFKNQHQAAIQRAMPRGTEQEAKMLGLSSADPAVLPKYGYFGQDNDNTLMYGAARVVFKPEVKERTTFTFGDTLMQGMVPSPATDPSLASMSPGQYEEILSIGGDPDDPYMESESANWGSADFDAAVENSLAGIPYVEAQIYGKLTPDDIAYVELPSENDMELTDPNTGLPIVDDPAALEHVRKLLDEKGIKWVEADLPGDYSGEWA